MEWVDADAKASLLEAIAQLMQIEDTAMHGTAAALRRIQPGPQPFKVRCLPAVDLDTQPTRRSQLHRVLWPALNRLGQFFRRHLSQREIDSGQMLAVQRIKFRVVCSAVFGAEPPTPV